MKDLSKSIKTWFEATFGELAIHVVDVDDAINTELIRVECKGRLPARVPWFGAEFLEEFTERFYKMIEFIDHPDIDLDEMVESPEIVSINQDPLLGPQWFRYVFKVKKIQP